MMDYVIADLEQPSESSEVRKYTNLPCHQHFGLCFQQPTLPEIIGYIYIVVLKVWCHTKITYYYIADVMLG